MDSKFYLKDLWPEQAHLPVAQHMRMNKLLSGSWRPPACMLKTLQAQSLAVYLRSQSRAGEMTQRLKVLVAIVEDPDQFPTSTWWFKTIL